MRIPNFASFATPALYAEVDPSSMITVENQALTLINHKAGCPQVRDRFWELTWAEEYPRNTE